MDIFSDPFPVLCRPALPKDSDDVLEMVSHIWEGHDYIPYVWQEWLADPQGILAVAESAGRVVGMGKLSRLSSTDWFMEGLRVHPHWQAQGIASRLNQYIVDYWQRNCEGSVRLATHNENVKVHHLCEKLGFKRLVEFIPYAAPLFSEPTNHFKPVEPTELSEIMDIAHRSPILAQSAGLLDLGWRWARLAEEHLQLWFDSKMIWWWRGKQAVIALWLDDEDEETRLQIQMVLCSEDQLPELLLDFRRLTAQLGKQQAGWAAPASSLIQAALQQAGFERGWDKSLYIFELTK